MQYDMVAVKTNVPWFEIILYAFMIGSVVLLFMSMYRGGAGGGGLMNVGRAKVKDSRKASARQPLPMLQVRMKKRLNSRKWFSS